MFVVNNTDRDCRPRSRRSLLNLPAALVTAVTLLLALSVAAHAKPLSAAVTAAAPEFTDWTSSRGNVARGTLLGKPITLSGSHVTEDPYSTVDGTHTYFAQPYFTPSLARSDAIEFRGHPNGYSYTLSFSEPGIQNPVIHFGSLASTLRFPAGTSITWVSRENASFSVSGSTVSGGLDGPNDSNGTVQLNGTFTSISFSAQTPGYLDGIYIQVGAAAAGQGSGSPPPCSASDADLVPTRSTHPDAGVRAAQDEQTRVRAENAVICLINSERTSRGLPALGSNSALGLAARRHSEDMAQRDYFRHCSYDLSRPEPEEKDCPAGYRPIDRVQNAGYPGIYRNENIAWGWGGSHSTPRYTVQTLWMDPQWQYHKPQDGNLHRDAILRPESNQIGVGVSLFAPTTYTGQAATYTANFGSH